MHIAVLMVYIFNAWLIFWGVHMLKDADFLLQIQTSIHAFCCKESDHISTQSPLDIKYLA